MHPFRPTPSRSEHRGWTSSLEVWEREFLAGLLDQVAGVLADDGPLGAEGWGSPGSGPAAPAGASGMGARDGESDRDADVLASLDFEPEDPEEATGPGDEPPLDEETQPLLEALLPDASEDPDVAVEIASMSRGPLRALKHERLEAVAAELTEPTGPGGAVLVREGEEAQWLGALNDCRLVLAERLAIEDAETAEAVHAAAWDDPPDEETDEERWHRGLALAYDMLTWWQESLVSVLLNAPGAA